MKTKLIMWINEELAKRDWSQRELARRGELSYATVSKVISGQLKPTANFCQGVARAFAINSLRNGMDIISLQRLLGHSNLDVINSYLCQMPDDLGNAHAKFGPVK